MILHFLKADVPLCKSYTLNPATGELEKQPYPNVRDFTSVEAEVTSVSGMAYVLDSYAKEGFCLLKGKLQRPLDNESRASATNAQEATEWVCLDVDGLTSVDSVDEFCQLVGLADIHRVVQWSNSSKLPGSHGLRCHLFFWLSKPTSPAHLKQWLMWLNLTSPKLASGISLTKSGMALRWPLDITTCQNDKLLYIAPPRLYGIDDPHPQRFQYEERTFPSFSVPQEALHVNVATLQQEKLKELRKNDGLPRKTANLVIDNSSKSPIAICKNPDAAQVTGIKEERGFVYLNVNGGDSWGYFHPADDIRFIYNFKGEPTYRTKDFLPSYYEEAAAALASKPSARRYLGFRDFRTATYWNGVIYHDQNDRLELAQCRHEQQVLGYLNQNGAPTPEDIPVWDLVFDPSRGRFGLDGDRPWVNKYNAPPVAFTDPMTVKKIPPNIHTLLQYVVGDEETIEHFLNWLAFIVQGNTRTMTCWVLQGIQGTGKGVLWAHVLTPLFGRDNVTQVRWDQMESEFTHHFENKFLVMIDEAQLSNSGQAAKVMAKMKNLLVEPMIQVRHMYMPSYLAENRANYIISSNEVDAVKVERFDRRYNVGGYMTQSILPLINDEFIDALREEGPAFYWYLKEYPVSATRAISPLVNQAKAELMETSRSAPQAVADWLIEGNLDAFLEMLPSDWASDSRIFASVDERQYIELMLDIVANERNKLSREEVQVMFVHVCGEGIPRSPGKFTSFCRHKRLHIGLLRDGDKIYRGIKVTWKTQNYREMILSTAKERGKVFIPSQSVPIQPSSPSSMQVA